MIMKVSPVKQSINEPINDPQWGLKYDSLQTPFLHDFASLVVQKIANPNHGDTEKGGKAGEPDFWSSGFLVSPKFLRAAVVFLLICMEI